MTKNGHSWPKMALRWRNFMTQNIPLWPKMSLHDQKWPLNISEGHNTWLYAILGHPGAFSEANVAPVGLWKGPRVVQHGTISCSTPMGSVLGPFGVMQGHLGPWMAIFGHEVAGGDNWAKKHEKWHRSTLFVQLLPQTGKAQSVTPQTTKYPYRTVTF